MRFEGKNVVRHDDEWFMNNKNTTGKMTYVEDTKIYEPTPPLVKNEEDRYSKQVDVGATQSLVSNELAQQYSNFFYDNSIDNSKGIEVAQATAVPGPLPMPIPPVAMPGSKENQQFVKDMNKAANAANNYIQKLATSLVTAPLVINSNINKITNDTLAKQEYVSPDIQQQRDAATIAEVTKLRAQRAQTANQAIAVTADDVAPEITQQNVRVTASGIATSILAACAALACPTAPLPGYKYKGGADYCTSKPIGDGLDSHHMPAASLSPLPKDMGPAIQMDPSDHRKTSSYGRKIFGPKYAKQKELLKHDQFMKAFYMDASEVFLKIDTKYAGAIYQAALYAKCLQKTGLVK